MTAISNIFLPARTIEFSAMERIGGAELKSPKVFKLPGATKCQYWSQSVNVLNKSCRSLALVFVQHAAPSPGGEMPLLGVASVGLGNSWSLGRQSLRRELWWGIMSPFPKQTISTGQLVAFV